MRAGSAGSILSGKAGPVVPSPLGPLRDALQRLRGDPDRVPDASIVIPVNAQGDLDNVLRVAEDLARYQGTRRFEVILVINNFPPESPPDRIGSYQQAGMKVVAIPNVRKSGEAVGFTARIPGVRVARSESVLLFDADIRIPRPTALLDWYVERLQEGCHLAYTPVGHYGYPARPSVYVHLLVHHVSRWLKRNLFGIPTNRGSNYAVRRSTMLELYDRGRLADEMNVGPNVKALGHPIAYSGARRLRVLTSGRMFSPGWFSLLRYFRYRLSYNLRVLPVRDGIARYTGREHDPVRRYIDNKPV